MAAKKPKPAVRNTAADTTRAVDDLMRALEHPLKKEIEAIRASVLAADPAIEEGVKWNAPSFRTTEYFATVNLREKKGIGIILHLGAKARDLPPGGLAVEDPERLLKWLARDRAMAVFEGMEDFRARQAAFERIVRQWIAQV